MHPIIIHQIAAIHDAEMRRRAEVHNRQAAVRRCRNRHVISRGVGSRVGQVWALLSGLAGD